MQSIKLAPKDWLKIPKSYNTQSREITDTFWILMFRNSLKNLSNESIMHTCETNYRSVSDESPSRKNSGTLIDGIFGAVGCVWMPQSLEELTVNFSRCCSRFSSNSRSCATTGTAVELIMALDCRCSDTSARHWSLSDLRITDILNVRLIKVVRVKVAF